jgi:hypothetical protein
MIFTADAQQNAVSFELENLDIETHGKECAPFLSSTTSGPSLAHLKRDFLAMKSEIKLKNANNPSANDIMNSIEKMLAGLEQMISSLPSVAISSKELRDKNAVVHGLYDCCL